MNDSVTDGEGETEIDQVSKYAKNISRLVYSVARCPDFQRFPDLSRLATA